MKACPYCSGELEEDAVKCRHCGEWVIKGRRPGGSRKKKKERRRGSKATLLLILALVAGWAGYNVLSLPGAPGGSLGGTSPRQMVKSELEELANLQEGYFLDHGTYSGSLITLGFEPSPSVRVSLTATPTGWSATATHENLPETEGCAVYGGTARPPQTPTSPTQPGVVICTD